MGFRLTYRTNYQSFNESNIVSNNQLYKSYQAENGYITPQLAWAMAKNLTKNGIRPYVTLDLAFNRDYVKTVTAGPDNLGVTGAYIGRSSNLFTQLFPPVLELIPYTAKTVLSFQAILIMNSD